MNYHQGRQQTKDRDFKVQSVVGGVGDDVGGNGIGGIVGADTAGG